jgi:O-antigen ligase
MNDNLSSMRNIHHYLVMNRTLWVRILIILGILFFTAFLSYKGSQKQWEAILLLLSGIIFTIALIRWPHLGLIIICIGGMVIPIIGPKNINFTILMIAMLFGLWLVELVVQKHQVRLAPSRTNLPLFAFLLVATLSFGIGQLPWFRLAQQAPLDAQLGGYAIFVISAIAFLLVANRMPNLQSLKFMTWSFLVIGGIYIAGRLVPGLSQINRWLFQPQAIGGVFWAWLPTLAFSQAVFNTNLRLRWRVLLVGLTLATLYVSLKQNFDWKSGWVPALVGVGTIITLRSWRSSIFLALVSIFPFISLASESLASDAYSISTRFDAWRILIEIIKASPVWGLGFANYYWYTPLYPIRGWNVKFNSHNNYVDIVAQVGLVGLTCFLWFVFEVARLAWQLRTRVRDGFSLAYVNGALAGLLATLTAAMLGDWMLPFVYNIGLNGLRTGILAWLFLGGLVFIGNNATSTAASKIPEDISEK